MRLGLISEHHRGPGDRGQGILGDLSPISPIDPARIMSLFNAAILCPVAMHGFGRFSAVFLHKGKHVYNLEISKKFHLSQLSQDSFLF